MTQSPAPHRRAPRVGLLLVPLLLTLGACQDTPLAPASPIPDPRLDLTATASSCLEATASDSSLVVGDSARLAATILLRRRNGRPVTGTPVWSSSNPAVVSVSGGYAHALLAGTSTLVATFSSCSASIPVSVTNPPATGDTTTPPPPPAAKQLPLVLTVFTTATSSPVSSNGILLPKGWLFERDLATTILHDGTREVARVLRPLAGRHADGSLRAILLQYQANPATPRVQLMVGTTHTLADPPAWPVPAGTPQAVTFPVDGAFIRSTLVGGAIATTASPFPTYESQFVTYAARHFQAEGVQWDQANYYDRALNHFVYWMRSGALDYWTRAVGLAINYRTQYLEANNYSSTPHWQALEGLAWHYWLTGDERSRTAVINTVAQSVAGYTPERLADPAGEYIEGRIQARMLIGSLLAGWLGDASRDWGALATRYVRAIQATQKADGSFSWPNWCGFQSNYMVGLQNDAMIKYYEGQAADSTIITTIRRSLDYMRRVSWMPSQQAFAYMTGVCSGSADVASAVDLNMLLVAGPAFVGARTGQRSYIAFADSIADGAMRGAWLDGSKQFNQEYYDSHLWLWYRR